jgi:hypothetical protein
MVILEVRPGRVQMVAAPVLSMELLNVNTTASTASTYPPQRLLVYNGSSPMPNA